MATPKHRSAPGSSYFVTTKCWQNRSLFQVTEVAEIMLRTLFHYRDSRAYLLHEFVIMHDHLHLMLTPNSETSLEKAVQLIKGGSSHRIHQGRGNNMEIWQEGFHDWTIRDSEDWKAKAIYIHMNPVKARLCERAEDWPYSSASGRYTLDPVPERYSNLTSGAKDQLPSAIAPGLKPRPPKEAKGYEENPLSTVQVPDCRTKNPPPGAPIGAPVASGAKAQLPSANAPGLKPRPPKEQENAASGGVEAPTPGASTKESPITAQHSRWNKEGTP